MGRVVVRSDRRRHEQTGLRWGDGPKKVKISCNGSVGKLPCCRQRRLWAFDWVVNSSGRHGKIRGWEVWILTILLLKNITFLKFKISFNKTTNLENDFLKRFFTNFPCPTQLVASVVIVYMLSSRSTRHAVRAGRGSKLKILRLLLNLELDLRRGWPLLLAKRSHLRLVQGGHKKSEKLKEEEKC